MDDLHSINEAINQKAGRKLLPSILVSILILVSVFGSIKISPVLFDLLVSFAMLLGINEIVRAYKGGGIEIPALLLYIAAAGLMGATWYGKISGLAVALAIVIPSITARFCEAFNRCSFCNFLYPISRRFYPAFSS
jgi:phosphatidate cytidylyltransferase